MLILLINVGLFVSRHIEYLCVDLSEFISPLEQMMESDRRICPVSVACAASLVKVEGVNKKAEVTAMTCVENRISFLSTVDHLLSIPTSGAGENFEMYSIPPASLGRVEFFNSHNSVADSFSLILSLFSLPFHFSPQTL